jgi:hypothetical protein
VTEYAHIVSRAFVPPETRHTLAPPLVGTTNTPGLVCYRYDAKRDGTIAYRIAGRGDGPSLLFGEADKNAGNVVAARIGGDSVLVSKGELMF